MVETKATTAVRTEPVDDPPATGPEVVTGRFLTQGMVYKGKVLRRVIFMWDGGQLDSELPSPLIPEDEEPPPVIPMNNYQRKVVRFFAGQPTELRLRGDQVADKVGENFETIRKHLGGLVAIEVLSNDKNKDGYGRGKNFTQAVASLDVP